jgi:hypothetical protein
LAVHNQLQYGTIKVEAVHSGSPPGFFWFRNLKMPQVEPFR